MIVREITSEEKENFNRVVDNPIQTWEWGEFKKSTGMVPIRLGVFEEGKLIQGYQVLLRKIPKLPFYVGQLLRSPAPKKQIIQALKELMEERNIVFIKLEPDVVVKKWKNKKGKIQKQSEQIRKLDFAKLGLVKDEKSFFSNYSFLLDITPPEEDLIMAMYSKTRYNIRLAEKKGVTVVEDSSSEGLEIFNELLEKTLKRQGFYMHSPVYLEKMWKNLNQSGVAHILLAKYKKEVLGAWILFIWKDKLYYPYGASSTKHRELMASNLLCWEAIRLGKKLGCKEFDMWGSMGPNPDKSHPWYGFTRFKRGYGGDLVEFVGSWDLVGNYLLYNLVKLANKWRWKLLHLRQKLPF